jgi:hypothetical protein
MPNLDEFWVWVKKTFKPDYRKEIEAYIAEAKNHVEVEARIKLLQRRGMI